MWVVSEPQSQLIGHSEIITVDGGVISTVGKLFLHLKPLSSLSFRLVGVRSLIKVGVFDLLPETAVWRGGGVQACWTDLSLGALGP